MSGNFDAFVVFAEMRTGSNFLEANLNAMEGLQCHGEAFNPHFIGYPNKSDLLGVTMAERDADPSRLIGAIKGAPGLAGFRFFHDHDARVLETVLDDPRCAKIILIRNQLDSYVSWKIAKSTNQWKLTDVNRRKEARAHFDAEEFAGYVDTLQSFQVRLLNRLQSSGQTPFYVAYEDLQDLAVMNGLARWLGLSGGLESLDKSLKVQNPAPVTEKVSNPGVMARALADLDRFNLSRTPNFEPRRGAAVPSYIAGAATPLLFLPIPGGPTGAVRKWLADLDAVSPDSLGSRMNQKQLRQWKREMPGHRSFTVLRHPVARAHEVFCRRILSTGEGSYLKIRDSLRKRFELAIPEGETGPDYSLADHRAAFEKFLAFVKANIAGQTAIRVDAAWCSQSVILSSFGDIALPDRIVREEDIGNALPDLARGVGHQDPHIPEGEAEAGPYSLSEIYDSELEALVADTYSRDYLTLGIRPWR